MLRVVSHIERLLMMHDCVIVPRLGGFVLQSVAAEEKADHHFCPGRKELAFNTALQHTDGLLQESYMRQYGVDYNEAQRMLDADVLSVINLVQQYKRLILGSLGTLYVGSDGKILFTPAESNRFSVDMYGLEELFFAPLEVRKDPLPAKQVAEKEEKESVLYSEEEQDTVYIPVSRKWLRAFAASVAAAVLFLLFSTPIEDVSRSAYTASFIPTEILTTPVVTPDVVVYNPASETTQPHETIAAHAEPKATTQPASAEKGQATMSEEKSELIKEAQPRQKTYHIVIASFPTSAQADEFMTGVDRQVYQRAGLVVRDGKYRIYADKFDNRPDAEAFLAALRTSPTYKDAWLFISR